MHQRGLEYVAMGLGSDAQMVQIWKDLVAIVNILLQVYYDLNLCYFHYETFRLIKIDHNKS